MTRERADSAVSAQRVAIIIILACTVYVHVVGQLYLGELGAIVILPACRKSIGRTWKSDPRFRRLVILGLLWFLSQLLSDYAGNVSGTDASRTLAAIVVLLALLCVLWEPIGSACSAYPIFVSLGLLLFASAFIQALPVAAANRWKFGAGIGVSILLSATASKRSPRTAIGLLAVLGLVSFVLDARSVGLFCILSACLSVGRGSRKRSSWRRRAVTGESAPKVSAARVLAGIGWTLTFVGVLFVITMTYARAAQSGLLGSAAESKYRMQDTGSLGVLVGGRPEVVESFTAILHRPLLGYGDPVAPPTWLAYSVLSNLRKLGYPPSPVETHYLAGSGVIQTHSYLMGAWVGAGLAGALFWIYAIAVVVKAFVTMRARPSPATPTLALLFISFGWNVLFSPFGTQSRIVAAATLALAGALLQRPPPPLHSVSEQPLSLGPPKAEASVPAVRG
jgi:hypothetical protein